METVSTFASNGLEGGVLVAVLVKALTTAGLPTKAAGFVAILLGFVIASLFVFEPTYPDIISPILLILELGAGFGLLASGAYSQLTAGKVSPPDGGGVTVVAGENSESPDLKVQSVGGVVTGVNIQEPSGGGKTVLTLQDTGEGHA